MALLPSLRGLAFAPFLGCGGASEPPSAETGKSFGLIVVFGPERFWLLLRFCLELLVWSFEVVVRLLGCLCSFCDDGLVLSNLIVCIDQHNKDVSRWM